MPRYFAKRQSEKVKIRRRRQGRLDRLLFRRESASETSRTARLIRRST